MVEVLSKRRPKQFSFHNEDGHLSVTEMLQALQHVVEPEKEELMHQLKAAKSYGRYFGNGLESFKKVYFLFVLDRQTYTPLKFTVPKKIQRFVSHRTAKTIQNA